eukprot:1158133-Pelagomonas_calceolata.AAC.11
MSAQQAAEHDVKTQSMHLCACRYNMLLNLMRVEGADPEALLGLSFKQFQVWPRECYPSENVAQMRRAAGLPFKQYQAIMTVNKVHHP